MGAVGENGFKGEYSRIGIGVPTAFLLLAMCRQYAMNHTLVKGIGGLSLANKG